MIAIVVFAFILYKVAISGTVELSFENGDLKEQISNNQNAPQQIKTIKKKIAKIEQLVGDEVGDETDPHQMLLGMVTQYCQQNKLTLKEFPHPFVLEDKGYITKTAKVVVEGDFIYLLKLVYHLESKYKVGKVVSVDFEAKKQLRTRRRKLNSTIYVQNIKRINDEKDT